MMAAAMGAEADVPVWLSVQRCLRSVVICSETQKIQADILIDQVKSSDLKKGRKAADIGLGRAGPGQNLNKF